MTMQQQPAIHQSKVDFMVYACEWSPFEPHRLAVGAGQHFGIVGNGKQHIMSVNIDAINKPQIQNIQPPVRVTHTFNTKLKLKL